VEKLGAYVAEKLLYELHDFLDKGKSGYIHVVLYSNTFSDIWIKISRDISVVDVCDKVEIFSLEGGKLDTKTLFLSSVAKIKGVEIVENKKRAGKRYIYGEVS